jgi:hypothetical protein
MPASVVLKVRAVFRLRGRSQLRNAGLFELTRKLTERNLRLNQKLARVDRRENLFFPRLRLAHRDFVADTKLEGLPLAFQARGCHHRHACQIPPTEHFAATAASRRGCPSCGNHAPPEKPSNLSNLAMKN